MDMTMSAERLNNRLDPPVIPDPPLPNVTPHPGENPEKPWEPLRRAEPGEDKQ